MRAVWITVGLPGLLLAASPAAARAATPAPVLERSVVVAPVSGEVRVRAKGARHSTTLSRPRSIPTGSFVDASRGTVRLVSAAATAGKTQTGRFDGGAFVVRQQRSALTDLVLATTRKTVDICGARTARSKPLPPKVLRSLRGRAKGQFRTVGRYAAATVRGTEWTTEDRCDGTVAAAQTGMVETAVGTQTFDLAPGMSVVAYCFPLGSAFKGPQYCTALVLQPASGIFGWGIGTRINAPTYDVCVRSPRGTERCTTRPLTAPDPTGLQTGAVVCQQGRIGGPGLYSVRWVIAGKQLGVPLFFTATLAKPPPGTPCLQRP